MSTVDTPLPTATRVGTRPATSGAAPVEERIEAASAHAAGDARASAQVVKEAVRDTSQQLRERAVQAQDMTVAYVKDEPIKAMLIAAATGALLMGLITMLGRSSRD